MIGPTRAPKLPEQPTSATEEFDHLVGDGLRIKKNINKDSLWIKGDGCRISLTTNSGKLRVSGDGCRVHIKCNLGSVEYTGDGGHIILGPETQVCDGVSYKGDGGLVEFAGKRQQIFKSQAKDAPSPSRATKARGDMKTKIVGSNNVQIHFNVRVNDKSS